MLIDNCSSFCRNQRKQFAQKSFFAHACDQYTFNTYVNGRNEKGMRSKVYKRDFPRRFVSGAPLSSIMESVYLHGFAGNLFAIPREEILDASCVSGDLYRVGGFY